ncbi:hypothetical protein BC831DRAFT_465321 [Entophlyctis helioformis]|nr:hypothetical protein BC831DRAFT_465321 [Entophlyctis helioformis]
MRRQLAAMVTAASLLLLLLALLPASTSVSAQGTNGTCPVCFDCTARGCSNQATARATLASAKTASATSTAPKPVSFTKGCGCTNRQSLNARPLACTACGSILMPPDIRPIRQPNTNCTCADGFTGTNCNVCTRNDVCAGVPGRPIGTTYVCNNQTKPWASAHHTSCTVKNPTLSRLFPAFTQFTMHRNRLAGTALGTVWYQGAPQFVCKISSCAQTWKDDQTNWKCSELNCKCNAGTSFCGGGGLIDLTGAINSAKGGLDLACNESTQQCNMAFDFLTGILPSGVALESCSFGECVDEMLAPQKTGGSENLKTLDTYGIVGISLVAVAALAAVVLLIIGCTQQRRRQLQRVPLNRPGVSILFNNVSYTIGGKVILRDVSGEAKVGTMLAIMGPSGAGKSTFLDILAGKSKSGKIKGSISTSDGRSHSALARISGFVDQDDVHLPTMTVREVLEFSAALRLPESFPAAERRRRVDAILKDLGLAHIADSRVGNSFERGISGGEKRRLSIGVELVTDPAVLFLDEPTSGLDSYNARQVMETLAELAHKSGRTIIFSIHQPRSDVYGLFDQILLLSKGSTTYFGSAKSASRFFAAQGLPCPDGYNIADHLLDIASHGKDNAGVDGANVVAQLAQQDDQMHLRNRSSVDAPVKSTTRLTEQHTQLSTETVIMSSDTLPLPSDETLSEPKYCASFLTQLSVLVDRSWRHFWRQPGLFIAHLAISTILGLFMGGLYWKADSSLGGIQNRLGSIFFLLSLMGFSSLSAISAFSQERLLNMRERATGFYSAGPLFISKVLFDVIPLRIIPGFILTAIPFFMIGFTSGVDYFLRYACVMVLFAANCGLFCFAIGCAIPEYGTAVLVASISLLFQMLFAGLLVNQVLIPAPVKWLQYLSFFKYAFEAIVVNDADGLRFVDQISGVDIVVPASVVLGKFGIDINSFWRDFTVSIGILFLLLAVVALLIRFRMRERR